MEEFENDLVYLIQNMKFRHVQNHCQNKVQKDFNHIKKDDHSYLPADKTNNHHRVKPAHKKISLGIACARNDST